MNILMITATYRPSSNGVAISLFRTVKELRKQGHLVYVAGPDLTNIDDPNYIRLATVHGLPFIPKDYPLVWPMVSPKTLRSILVKPWDIIHVHHPSVYLNTAKFLGKLLRVPIIFTYHTQYDQYINHLLPWLPHYFREIIYREQIIKSCQTIDGIVAPSKWIANMLKSKIEKVPIFQITTAGLTQTFLNSRPKQQIRKLLGLPEKITVFLSVSRLTREKNIKFLLAAFAVYAKKDQTAQLNIIGDGSEKEKLIDQANIYNLKSRINFFGNVPNEKLSNYYTASDVFLFSSKTDVSSLTLLEAMSAGLPVVALGHQSLTDILIDRKNSVIAQKTITSFAECMEYAVSQRGELRSAATTTAKNFMISIIVKQLLEAYRQTIERHNNNAK